MFCRCNNNEGFVHERYLTKTENKHENSPLSENGNADKLSMISPQVKARKFSSKWDELETRRIGESEEVFPSKEKNPLR